MKWLAVDYGDSRTGLAGCDAGETITSPITPQIEEKSMNKVAAAVTEVFAGPRSRGPRLRFAQKHGRHRGQPCQQEPPLCPAPGQHRGCARRAVG